MEQLKRVAQELRRLPTMEVSTPTVSSFSSMLVTQIHLA